MTVATQEHIATETKLEQAPAAQLPAIHDPHARAPEKKPARKREESIINIATAIANITREVGIVAKAGFNAFHRYKFAQMQDVLQKLTPLMAKHGLVIVQTEVGRSMFDDERAVAVEYQFTIAHISGEIWPDKPKQTGLCRCRDSKGGFDDKALNKCHTAARKYFLLALFQIATGEEDDADQGHNDAPRRPPPPAANVMAHRPAHDAQTGEIVETPQGGADGQAPSAADRVGSPAAEGGEAMSVEAMARAAAMRGRDVLRTFCQSRSKADRVKINAIQAELESLIPTEAADAPA